MSEAVAAALVTVVTLAGWILVLGYIYVDRRERRNTAKDNMLWARADERDRLLRALAPVVKWGCAPALGGGLTDVDGVWASEIFKVLPDLEPLVIALIDGDDE